MSLTRYETLAGLDNLFNEFFRPAQAWDGTAGTPTVAIRFDVRETADAYAVTADLPGVTKDAIHVEIEGNEVKISAETRQAAEQKDGEKWLRVERHHGKVARRFSLPQEVDESKATATFTDGVLELTLPKKAPATGRRLQVQ